MLFILSSKVGVTSFACFSASYLSKCHCPLLATCCNDVSKLNSRGSEKGNSGAELREFREPTEFIPNSRQQIDTAHAPVAS